MNNLLLSLLAFATIFSSVLVITSKNPVVAVIFLISVFLCSAELLLVLGVGFVGISYIILYVGAIIVLFLFVLMSINIKLTDILEAGSQYTKNIPLALSIGLLFSYELIKLLPFNIKNISILESFVVTLKALNHLMLGTPHPLRDSLSNLFTTLTGAIDTKIHDILQIEILGNGLCTLGASVYILCGVILLLSLSGPIILSKKDRENTSSAIPQLGDRTLSISSEALFLRPREQEPSLLNNRCEDYSEEQPGAVSGLPRRPRLTPCSALRPTSTSNKVNDAVRRVLRLRKGEAPSGILRANLSTLNSTKSLVSEVNSRSGIRTGKERKQIYKDFLTSLSIPISPNKFLNKILLGFILFSILPSIVLRFRSIIESFNYFTNIELEILMQACVIILALALPILTAILLQRISMVSKITKELLIRNRSLGIILPPVRMQAQTATTAPTAIICDKVPSDRGAAALSVAPLRTDGSQLVKTVDDILALNSETSRFPDLNFSVISMFTFRAISVIIFSMLGVLYSFHRLSNYWSEEFLVFYTACLVIYIIYFYCKHIKNNGLYTAIISTLNIKYFPLKIMRLLFKIVTTSPLLSIFSLGGLRLLGSLGPTEINDVEASNEPGILTNVPENITHTGPSSLPLTEETVSSGREQATPNNSPKSPPLRKIWELITGEKYNEETPESSASSILLSECRIGEVKVGDSQSSSSNIRPSPAIKPFPLHPDRGEGSLRSGEKGVASTLADSLRTVESNNNREVLPENPVYGPEASPDYISNPACLSALQEISLKSSFFEGIAEIFMKEASQTITRAEARLGILLLTQEANIQDARNGFIPVRPFKTPSLDLWYMTLDKFVYLNGTFSYCSSTTEQYIQIRSSNILELVYKLDKEPDHKIEDRLGESKESLIKKTVSQYKMDPALANSNQRPRVLETLFKEKQRKTVINLLWSMYNLNVPNKWLEFEKDQMFIIQEEESEAVKYPKRAAVWADGPHHLRHSLKSGIVSNVYPKFFYHYAGNFKDNPIYKKWD